MASDIFVDSSGYFALLNKRDDRHAEARSALATLASQGRKAVTTDYVLDESATLLRARGFFNYAALLLENIRLSEACRVVHVTPQHFNAAATLFLRYHDQNFSFTDCVSFVVMQELRLTDTLSKDNDFKIAGFNPLLR